jgi:hypothetical protein
MNVFIYLYVCVILAFLQLGSIVILVSIMNNIVFMCDQ